MGLSKKNALQILGVSKDHLAESLMGGHIAFPEHWGSGRRMSVEKYYFTLPALQKTFVDYFFEFAWEFCIERCGGFLVGFSGLHFPRNEARKFLKKKSGGNSEQNSGQNWGRKFENFGELAFCNFCDLIFI